MTVKLTILIITLAILFLPTQINAQIITSPIPSFTPAVQSNDIPYESVNPPDGLPYLLKRIKEKINISITFTDEGKVNSYRKLVNIRLAELKFIVENKQMGYFEQSTQRYFTTVGELAILFNKLHLEDEPVKVKEQLLSHIPILTKLRDSFDPLSAEWRFVEDDINYVKVYIEKIPAR